MPFHMRMFIEMIPKTLILELYLLKTQYLLELIKNHAKLCILDRIFDRLEIF